MGLNLLAGPILIAAVQAAGAGPTPRVAAPDVTAPFSATRGAIKFDKVSRGVSVAQLPASPACAERARRGETAASIELAMATIIGAGSGEEARSGLAVLERSIAAENHPAAHYLLGTLLGTGERLPPDYPKAVRHLEQAVAGGNVAAMDLLATLVLEGRGTAQDVPRAISLYERAMAAGMEGAASRLALLYLQGDYLPRDQARARAILDSAAAAGDPAAASMLTMMTAKVTAYQMHPGPDGAELRVYGSLDTPPVPPAFGFTDDFRKLHYSAYGDPQVVARLEREQASLPTPYLYELARRIAPASAGKARGYWMLARLRMIYDSTRCSDPASIEAVGAWDMIVMRDLNYTMAGIAPSDMKAAIEFALEREAAMPGDTRPWWVCYSGMATYSTALDKKPPPLALKPAAQWPKLRQEARERFKALLTAPPAK
jgi:Sel1 repeat